MRFPLASIVISAIGQIPDKAERATIANAIITAARKDEPCHLAPQSTIGKQTVGSLIGRGALLFEGVDTYTLSRQVANPLAGMLVSAEGFISGTLKTS